MLELSSFIFLNSSVCCGILLEMCRGLGENKQDYSPSIVFHCKESKSMEELPLLKTVQLNVSFLLHHPRAPISPSHCSFEGSTTKFASDSKSWRASSACCDYLGVFRLFFQAFFTPLFMETLLAVAVIDSKLYRGIHSIFAASFLRDFLINSIFKFT